MTIPPEIVAKRDHDCCWHDKSMMYGGVLTTYPPQPRNEVCCHCGHSRTVQPEPPPIPEGHGKHYPRPTAFGWTAY